MVFTKQALFLRTGDSNHSHRKPANRFFTNHESRDTAFITNHAVETRRVRRASNRAP